VSSIWDEAKLVERKDKINSAIVIREFISSAYERQGEKRNITPLTVSEREYFMMGIAVGMMKYNEYSNQISKEKLNKVILDLYDNFPLELSSTKTAFEKGRNPLKERMKENEELAKDSILTDVRACGILIKDLSRINHFRFAHKSFMEYLVSEYYVLSLLDKDNSRTYMAHSISKSFNDSIVRIKKSEETTNFISQLIASEYHKDDDLKPDEKAKSILKLFYNSKIFSPKLSSYVSYHIFAFFVFSIVLTLLVSVNLAFLNEKGSEINKIFYMEWDSPLLIIIYIVFIVFLIVLFFITYWLLKIQIRMLRDLRYGTIDLNSDYIDFKTEIKIWYLACRELSIERPYLKKLLYYKYLLKIEEDINNEIK